MSGMKRGGVVVFFYVLSLCQVLLTLAAACLIVEAVEISSD